MYRVACPKTVRRTVSDEQTDEWHRRFEEAEDQRDPQSSARVDAGDADPNRCSEVVEPNGKCAQHKREHNHGVSLPMASVRCRCAQASDPGSGTIVRHLQRHRQRLSISVLANRRPDVKHVEVQSIAEEYPWRNT